MKTKLTVIILLFALVIVSIAGIIIFKSTDNTVVITSIDNAQAFFRYGDTDVSDYLSNSESSLIANMFDGKNTYKDKPFCGFTEDISVRFGDSQTFCIACDTCPIIYWKEKDVFFTITDKEQAQLYDILEAHGFCFPCV